MNESPILGRFNLSGGSAYATRRNKSHPGDVCQVERCKFEASNQHLNARFAVPKTSFDRNCIPLVPRERRKASSAYRQGKKYPLQFNIDATMAQRLAYISYALRDGDVKEAEQVYKELANSTIQGADSELRLEGDPPDEH